MLTKKAQFLMILCVAFIFTGKVYAEQKDFVNSRGITHKSSGGMSVVFPDVCKTPSLGGSVPIPNPNIGKSSDTTKDTKKVKTNGKPIVPKHSNLKMGIGDEAGVGGGKRKEYYRVKSHPKVKPNATVNYPRPAYHKYLTPSDN